MELFDKGLPVPPADEQLGVMYTKKNVTFALWAPGAESVSVLIYKTDKDLDPVLEFTLLYNSLTGVWNTAYVKDPAVGLVDIEGFFYEFKVVRNGVEKTVLDPYAYSLACFTGDNNARRAAIIDIKSTKAKADGGWFPDAREPLLRRSDAIIYEVSVRDFSISADSAVHVEKGTFDALIEQLPYIARLGVTCLQLMPVLSFANHDERNRAYQTSEMQPRNYNWGYDPRGYFSPDGWFAADPHNPYSRVHDLRNLVAAAHSMGIKVILDVVYNHVADTTYFEDIVPGYFFRRDANGHFTNASGCGNDLATERYMVRKLIVDSTRYLMRSFRVDGFRFDLMGLIDTKTIQDAYEACAVILPDVLFIGEGWLMYNGEQGTRGMDQNYASLSITASMFNDGFRDIAKGGGFNEFLGGFLTGKDTDPNRLFRQLTGHPENYQTLVPDSNVQFLACHDGLTLFDSLCVNTEQSSDKDWYESNVFRRHAIGNFMVLTSQGIAFLQSGQEYGRTKRKMLGAVIAESDCIGEYVRNSYNAGDDVNKIVWTLSARQRDLFDYTAALIALRRRLSVFHFTDYAAIDQSCVMLRESDNQSMGYRMTAPDGGTWFVLYNMATTVRTFRLSDVSDDVCSNMVIFADGAAVYSTAVTSSDTVSVENAVAYLQPLSCALLGDCSALGSDSALCNDQDDFTF